MENERGFQPGELRYLGLTPCDPRPGDLVTAHFEYKPPDPSVPARLIEEPMCGCGYSSHRCDAISFGGERH